MNSFFKKIATGTAALALTTTVFASSAFAAETSTVITGEDVTITNTTADAFPGVTLDGTTKTITASLSNFDVTDARGTGTGWNVAIEATPFNNPTAPAGKSTLSTGSLNLMAPTVIKNDEGSSDLNTITTAGGNIDAGSVKVLSAAENGGMGSYNASANGMTLTLLPKEVYAGTYTSNITVTLTTGP